MPRDENKGPAYRPYVPKPPLTEEERKQKNAKTLLEGVEEFRNKAKQVLSEKNQQKSKKS
mgnify:CR=1 FL=1